MYSIFLGSRRYQNIWEGLLVEFLFLFRAVYKRAGSDAVENHHHVPLSFARNKELGIL
jgi:hypothetical protein